MKLSAEQFAALAASFASNTTAGKLDRRRASRRELQARVKITPVFAGRKLHFTYVVVSDFSARGLAFLDQRAMTIGQQFITELPRNSGGSVQLLCTVRDSAPLSEGLFRIGAEFTCVLQPSVSPGADNPGEAARIRESMFE